MFLRQPEALGLGHAVLCAEPAIGREPFLVLLTDDVMRGTLPTGQLVEAHSKAPGTILSVLEVAPEDAQKYGIIKPGRDGGVAGLVENPEPGRDPSVGDESRVRQFPTVGDPRNRETDQGQRG